MKHYYGYDSEEELSDLEAIADQDNDLIILESRLFNKESIPLLMIHPQKTTLLFDDYGFFSDSGQSYLYLEMICAFFITDGNEQQVSMFLLQVEEELIAVHEEKRLVFILDRQHEQLIQKWAASYMIEIEFLIS
jgi:hypothetical protein